MSSGTERDIHVFYFLTNYSDHNLINMFVNTLLENKLAKLRRCVSRVHFKITVQRHWHSKIWKCYWMTNLLAVVGPRDANASKNLRWFPFVSFQYNIEKKANDEDEDEDDSDFEGSKKAVEEDLDGMACKFANLYDRLCYMTTRNTNIRKDMCQSRIMYSSVFWPLVMMYWTF